MVQRQTSRVAVNFKQMETTTRRHLNAHKKTGVMGNAAPFATVVKEGFFWVLIADLLATFLLYSEGG